MDERKTLLACIATMTEREMQSALHFISGYSPEGVAAAIDLVEQYRAWDEEARA